jgi:hypothetical protein
MTMIGMSLLVLLLSLLSAHSENGTDNFSVDTSLSICLSVTSVAFALSVSAI